VKLVHAADLHVDSPMRGLERYEGAPVERMRSATRGAVEQLVALCLNEEVDVLLLAGDVFDGDWKDYATGLFFARQMADLREAGVRVVSIRGNHDAASQIRKQLSLPDNVRELATRRPETVVFDDLGLAVHGQGFARRAVTDDLAGGYPAPVDGMLNVGLLHTCLTGREGHEPYAPCRLETLVDRGYDYWALGHVHQQEILHERPWVAFSGNLQGRHARETGPKGALLVVADGGRVTAVEPRVLDVARWCALTVDVSEATAGYDAVDRVREALAAAWAAAEERPLAVRITLTGSSTAHDALVREPDRWDAAVRAVAQEEGEIWVERLRVRTTREVRLEEVAGGDDAVGHVARRLVELGADPQARRDLVGALDDLLRKLPPEVRADMRFDDEESSRALVGDVADLLMARLAAVDDAMEERE
jgi:DNA repair exonuclease SbcCD nuclease subunit